MPYYFDLHKQEVIFSRYEYTPQYLDGEWVDLPKDNTCYAIKNGQAIFEGSPEEAFNQSYDKVILKNQGSLPIYRPETTINIVNDSPSEQTMEQQQLLEYLQSELEALKSGQQVTATTAQSHETLIQTLSGQIDTLNTSMSGAPSQKTIEQQAAIDFLKSELEKLKETGVPTTTVIETSPDNQQQVIESLNKNFEALTELIANNNLSSKLDEIQTLKTDIENLKTTTSNSSNELFAEQNNLIASLTKKISELENSPTGPSDLTIEQQTLIDTLKGEINNVKEEYQKDLVGALNNRVDHLTALLSEKSISQTPIENHSSAKDVSNYAELLEYLKNDLAWNIVNLKSEVEKLKDGELEIDKENKLDNLNSYLNALTNSLEAHLASTSIPAIVPQTPSATQGEPSIAPTSNTLTDGFFIFEDNSTPLYTYRAPSRKHS